MARTSPKRVDRSIAQLRISDPAEKYANLIVQANNSTGRKETLSLVKQATKLKTKLDQYEMK